MSRKCYHCGEPLSEKDKVCPRCGADATVSRKPKTIYELRAYCAEKHVPLADIRFFIGEDYREPRAFGIYQDDDGQFVVYKNKADGSRAIRYHGYDEAYAVNEIYEKLKSEVDLRRAKKSGGGITRGGGVTRSGGARRTKKRSSARMLVLGMVISIFCIVILILTSAFLALRHTPHRGYYHYNDNDYYYYNNWYLYDEDEWVPVSDVDDTLREDYNDYRTDTYDGDERFEDSAWYDYEYERTQSSYDDDDDDWDDDDWDDDDWDDWDTDDTDWDSDW